MTFTGRLLLMIIALILIAIAVNSFHFYFAPITRSANENIVIRIETGESLDQVAQKLEARGLITSALLFEIMVRFKQQGRALKSGLFEVKSDATPPELIKILTKAPAGEEKLYTFPEGLNQWQMADLMAKYGWSRDTTLQIIKANKWEGRLFPDSYRFGPKESARSVLGRMNKRFTTVWSKLRKIHGTPTKFTPSQLLTLASLVEKEMVVKDEAPIIAKVFLNRLEKNMKLQSDPTYVYTAKRYGKKPTKADRLRKGNPYNTDQIRGLPPGPIANPGRHALQAVLKPSTNPKARTWLFFVAKRDGTGRHHFSSTYAEHKRAVRRYLKKK